MNLSDELQSKLQCPATKTKLVRNGNFLESSDGSSKQYPIENNIPILINEDASIFLIEQFVNQESTTFENASTFKRIISSLTPSLTASVKTESNYNQLAELLPNDAKILVIGGSIRGKGMDAIYSNSTYEIVGSDVSHGPYTTLICDSHDIPFDDETFDCVILQAVLEHVLDPQQCVSETHRVLKDDGLVYAETPFMQQVHMRQFDFTRFTHLGHRRLFRFFDELGSGPVTGPGSALAWSYTYFLRSLVRTRAVSQFLAMFGRFTSFFFKYVDYFIIDKPGSYDAAAGMYFIGRKTQTPLSDKDLIEQYRGFK
jgi:SAM-dependent methyltransferase